MQRGVNKSTCFTTDADRGLYLAMLEEVAGRVPCSVHAYVLMSNHVHLLLSPLEAKAASLLMKNLGQRYVRRSTAATHGQARYGKGDSARAPSSPTSISSAATSTSR